MLAETKLPSASTAHVGAVLVLVGTVDVGVVVVGSTVVVGLVVLGGSSKLPTQNRRSASTDTLPPMPDTSTRTLAVPASKYRPSDTKLNSSPVLNCWFTVTLRGPSAVSTMTGTDTDRDASGTYASCTSYNPKVMNFIVCVCVCVCVGGGGGGGKKRKEKKKKKKKKKKKNF